MEIIETYRAMSSASVGGKFASQARLHAQGLPIAEFFCLSRTMFDRAIGGSKREIEQIVSGLDLDSRPAIVAAAARIQRIITNLTLDQPTIDAIMRVYDRHFAAGDLVSVRACMVSERREFSEDSATNPFAGISESFLYVTRDEVIEKIKQCWASAFAEKALVYRLSQQIDLRDVSVAVGVQRMIMGQRSFVMFTCDPNTLARDTILIAGYGIGEGVVQELVPVDHYFVSGKTGQIERVIADKQSALDLDRERGRGVRTYAVPEPRRTTACLTEREIRSLAAYGQRIEQVFGAPQDIEGTIAADGRIVFLQARPIAIDYATQRVWTNLNVTESYPGVSSPLTFSLARLFYRVIFYDLYRRLGVSQAELHRNAFLLDRMLGYVNGRVYYALSAFYLLHQQIPIFPWLRRHWEEMIGLPTSYVIRAGESVQEHSRLRQFGAIGASALVFSAAFVGHAARMQAFKRWWIGRSKQSRALLKQQPDALAVVEEFYRLWRDVGEQWGVTLVNDAYIFTLYGLVARLLKQSGLDDPALLSNLLCGDDEIESVEIFLSILRIAEQVKADADSARLFLEADDAQLVELYRRRELDGALLARLDRHIEQYGDRSMEELKMENPSLREDPTVLLRGIRRFVKSELNAAAFKQGELANRANAERMLDRRFGPFSPRKQLLKRLLQELRQVIAHRENSRYCRSELFGLCKDMFRFLGDYLHRKGALDDPADVYFLTVDAIMGYVDGSGVDERFQETVAERKREHAAYAAKEADERFSTSGALRDNALARTAAALEEDALELHGLGSSMGVARGMARVIADPNSTGELAPGTILVAKETDPGWLFLMLASSGIVVERGSMLSHTAITGRKFGIPTIVGVPQATTRIPDGAQVEIDGGSGVVKIISGR